MLDSNNPYTQMQKKAYAEKSSDWTPQNRNPVVGSFDAHNAHIDYVLLFSDLDTKNMIGLDFGCGPGRNLVTHGLRFKRLDGVDLDPINLKNAKIWLETNKIPVPNLYECNGVDLSNIPNEEYDFVMSTICMQHICVHEIRYNYFKEFYRVLRNNGWIAIQMGFGKNSPHTVDYYANYYEAKGTNRACDTRIDSPDQLQNDLTKIGYKNFRHWIRPVGPGDVHPNWIFFQAQKLN